MYKKTIIGRAVAVLAGITLALVCAETGLRVYGVVAVRRQLRRNMEELRVGNAYRVMCLGESTTMGQYPRFLGPMLNAMGGGRKFVVIDRGVTGIHTNEILAQLDRNLDEYRPDIVVAMMGINFLDSSYVSPDGKMFMKLRLAQLVRWMKKMRMLSRREESAPARPYEKPAVPGACRLQPDLDTQCLSAVADSGDFPKAEELYRKAISAPEALPMSRETACTMLSELQYGRGDASGALATLARCSRALHSCNLHLRHAQMVRRSGKPREALRLLKTAAEGLLPSCRDEQRGEAYIQLGEIYDEMGRNDGVEDSMRKAIELKPGVSEWHYLLGNYLAGRGRKEESAEEFEKALALMPANAPRAYGLSAALADMKGDAAMALRAKSARLSYSMAEAEYYRLLKRRLFARGIPLVAVQYPMRPVEELKIKLEYDPRVIFVDNEALFRNLVRQGGYAAYFVDRFAGDFGHCTDAGNRLLAKNIAKAILAALN